MAEADTEMTVLPGSRLAEWCNGVWRPGPPADIRGVSTDTRTLKRGELYFALRGPNFDGHAFVGAAFERGACGAVVDRAAATGFSPERPLLVVQGSAVALREIARGYRAYVDPQIVAVTGSAGKTTGRAGTGTTTSAFPSA